MKSHKRFDKLSVIYDLLVNIVFVRAIQKSQIALIKRVENAHEWLILGGGTGWILDEIFKIHPDVKITYVEASQKMISKARRKEPQGQVNYVLGSIDQIPPEKNYDVVMTAFFWDMFSTKKAVRMKQSIDQKIKNDAIWLLADFKNTDIWWQEILIKVMYWFFRSTCHIEASELPDFDQIFIRGKHTKQFRDTFYNGMIESTVYNYTI